MTFPVRIPQADMQRAILAASKAMKRTGLPTRVIFRPELGEIEVLLGDHAVAGQVSFDEREWADDDV